MPAMDVKTFGTAILLLLGVVDDLRSRKVRNTLVLFSFFTAFIILFISDHWNGLYLGLASLVTAFVISTPLFILKVFGGGDLKLFVAVAPLLSWMGAIETLTYSFFWGLTLGLIQIILNKQSKAFITNMGLILMRQKPNDVHLSKIPYTVALFLGFLTHVSLSQKGMGIFI